MENSKSLEKFQGMTAPQPPIDNVILEIVTPLIISE